MTDKPLHEMKAIDLCKCYTELNDKENTITLKTPDVIDWKTLREWAIACVKNIMENSVNEWATERHDKDPMDWEEIMPNGKVCYCDPEMQCEYHYTGLWLMDKFDIKPEELKQEINESKL